jgi:sugar (pentulose or hexulose) kinase
MTGDVWIGLDLGTSGLKGVAVSSDGSVLARGQHAYPTTHPEHGACEQDPQHWLVAVAEVVAQLRAEVEPARWAAIGLSAMLPTLVTVDRDGVATGPAITWEDGRAEAESDMLRERVGADALYRRTGQWVDGRYLLPMWMRLRRTEPERAARTTGVWAAKDWLLHELTGCSSTDPSTAAGFGCYDLDLGAWDQALAGVASVPSLPDVVSSSARHPLTVAASARLGLPAGLPVAVGAADSVCGALGMGAHAAGDVAYVAGTSTVILGLWGEHVLDPDHRFLVTPTSAPGMWGLEMDLVATGSAFRWLAGLVGVAGERELLELAAMADPADVPLVLPYVGAGEQGALWDPDLAGSIIGLHMGHTAGDLALGLVQGILHESRRCLRTLEALGLERGPIRVAGGSVSDPWFRQQLADASGRVVIAPSDGDSDASAIGAAMIAAQGLGVQLPLLGATSTSVPRASEAARWHALAQRLERARGLIGHG